MNKRLDHSLVCAEDCRYRALYEGSQMSLTDLATRQAAALDRIGRIRAFLVALLKRERPTEFAAAEQQLGQRMSDVDDDVLLAYVDGLLTDEAPMLAALAAELESSGYNTRNARTLEGLIAAVRAGNENNETRIPAQTEPGPGRVKKPGAGTANTPKPGNVRNQKTQTWRAGNEPREPEPTKPEETHSRNRQADSAHDLGHDRGHDNMFTIPDQPEPDSGGWLSDLIAAADQTGPASDTASDPASSHSDDGGEGGGLGDIFATRPDTEPGTEPESANDSSSGGEPDTGLGDIFATEPDADTPTDDAAGDGPGGELGDIFADHSEVEPDANTATGGSGVTSSSDGLGDIFATEPDTGTGTEPGPADGSGGPGTALDDIFATQPETADPPKPGTTDRGMRTVNTEQLKPEMVRPTRQQKKSRQTTAKKPKVTPRTKATAADSPPAVADADSLHNKLLAAACIPRPVFIADLNDLAGDARAVAEWEQETRNKPDRGLRFVAAKQRHKQRGSLVVPHDYARTATVEFTDSCWGSCLGLYRGSRLYETGVLLHHLGDSIVTHRAGPDIITMRLNQRKGIVGMVVVVNDKLNKHGSTRQQLTADLDELVNERLFEIVIAVANNEWHDPVKTIVEQAHQQNGWEPAMPVTLTRTWDYAAGVNQPVNIIN